MPRLINESNSRLVSFGFVDVRGQRRSVSARIGNNAFAGGELSALSNALGDASNAAVYRETESFERAAKISALTALDESESSVNTVLVIVAENNSGERISIGVPAIDTSLLGEDMSSLIAGDPVAAAGTAERIAADLRSTVVNAINNSYTPANSYAIARTYTTDYSGRGTKRGVELPAVAETVASGPPAEPAV